MPKIDHFTSILLGNINDNDKYEYYYYNDMEKGNVIKNRYIWKYIKKL